MVVLATALVEPGRVVGQKRAIEHMRFLGRHRHGGMDPVGHDRGRPRPQRRGGGARDEIVGGPGDHCPPPPPGDVGETDMEAVAGPAEKQRS